MFPEFLRQGRKRGPRLLFGKVFAETCMKIKEIEPSVGAWPWCPLGCATKFDFREILLPAMMQLSWPISQKSQYKDIFRTKEIQQCAHVFKANYCFNVHNARHFRDKYYRLPIVTSCGYYFPFQTLVGRFGSLFSYCDDCKSAIYANIVKITNNQTTLRGSGL